MVLPTEYPYKLIENRWLNSTSRRQAQLVFQVGIGQSDAIII